MSARLPSIPYLCDLLLVSECGESAKQGTVPSSGYFETTVALVEGRAYDKRSSLVNDCPQGQSLVCMCMCVCVCVHVCSQGRAKQSLSFQSPSADTPSQLRCEESPNHPPPRPFIYPFSISW